MKRLASLLFALVLTGQACDPKPPPEGGNAYCAGNDYSIVDGIPYGWDQDGIGGAYSAIKNGSPSGDRRSTVQVTFGSAYCSGVILDAHTVLTAGHCGYAATTAHTVKVLEPTGAATFGAGVIEPDIQRASQRTGLPTDDPSELVFEFNAAGLEPAGDALAVTATFSVATHTVHPDYMKYVNSGNINLEARKADLMVLHVDEALPGPYVGYAFYEPGLAPVCQGLVAQGLGRWEGSGLSLREGRYVITTQTDKYLISRTESTETKICFGDSGGPLYADVAGVPQLAGVVSTTMSLDCLIGGTHVNVAYPPFHAWILATVAESKTG